MSSEGGESISANQGQGRWRHRRWTRNGGERGVSDIVGTILLLGLTVTLFSSIFFFVNTFPQPPTQSANQFQAGLGYNSAGSQISAVTIAHLGGPTLSGSGVLIYLYSSAHPTRFTSPYHIPDGLNGSNSWALGQNWFLNLTNKTLMVPDNITVSIATQTVLLFRVTLPGSNPDLPPTFVAQGTNPAAPAIGQGFKIFVQIVDPDLKANSVFVNISQLPGVSGTGTFLMVYSAATNLWTYTVANGITNNGGTFYLFVNATDALGQRNSVAFPVTITSGAVTQANVALSAAPSLPVIGSPVSLTALVSNPGSAGGSVIVTFTAGGTLIGSQSGSVPGGGSASFTQAWTPAATGTVTVAAQANITGGGSVSGTLNITVFPKILFIAHNVVAGQNTVFNESAYLAQSLVSAGIPFALQFISCTSGLPTSVAMGAYGVVVIDFGSNPSAGCSTARSAAEQLKITGTATTTSFWLVGQTLFGAATCSSYSNNLYNLIGAKYAGAGNCNTLVAAGAAANWVPSAGNGIRGDGIGTIAINKTLAGSSVFQPYSYFTQLTTNPGLLTTAVGSVASWQTNGVQRAVGMATDPALIASALGPPASQNWVDNSAGTEIAYNVMNYLCGFAGAGGPGRGLLDHAVGGILVFGQSHSAPTTVYAELRTNGPVAEVLTVTLYVNGAAALYQGVVVSATVAVGANGQDVTVSLTWQAPAAGSFTLSVVISTPDNYFPNNQMPASILNQPVTFA